MSLTLYRKYRPQTFKEVIGQNHIKTTIQSELETGKVAHAYLFSGPRGLGKTTTARLLAKAINCLKRKEGQSEPCNDCESCNELMAARSLDIIEIDAASHTGVDNVRENIINNSRFTPTSRKFKVFIIDEVHMLSISAFNALLKTLEEPPAHAIFILATTEIHKVPQTIISRCQHFDFRKVSEQEIVARLASLVSKEKRVVDKSILENIAYYAEGGIRDAESLLGQILSLSDKEITVEQAELVLPQSHFNLVLELIENLNKKDTVASLTLINHLVQEGVDLERFAGDLIEVLRKILLLKISSQLGQFAGGLNKDLEKRITDLANQIALDLLIGFIEILLVKKQELKFCEILQLPLELAILEILAFDNKTKPQNDNDQKDDSEKGSGLKNKTEEKKTKETPADKPIKAAIESDLSKNKLVKVKLTIDQIKEKWQDVLVCMKNYNQSLASTLKISQPSTVKEDGTLEICFRHQFHQQRINDLKNKQILEKVLGEIFGQTLIVKTLVVKDLPDLVTEIQTLAEPKSSSSLNNILESFGGQVVN
ncbi:MAG: DNA polymerase III subunit gamma/tau [Candidatus Buchananbacteria bacterium]